MLKLNEISSKYRSMKEVDDETLGLTVKQVFQVLPKTFKMINNQVENRAMVEKQSLTDGYGRFNGIYHLLPGYYEIIFNGIVELKNDEVAVVTPRFPLIQNGIGFAEREYKFGAQNISTFIEVRVADFQFDVNTPIAYLRFKSTGNVPVVKTFAEEVKAENEDGWNFGSDLKKVVRDHFLGNNAGPITGNPLVDNIANLERSDKFTWANNDIQVHAVPEKPKRTNVDKGKKWAYIVGPDGMDTDRVRVSVEEFENEYKAKGYVIGYPPSFKAKRYGDANA
jgi:hypothetical protein